MARKAIASNNLPKVQTFFLLRYKFDLCQVDRYVNADGFELNHALRPSLKITYMKFHVRCTTKKEGSVTQLLFEFGKTKNSTDMDSVCHAE